MIRTQHLRRILDLRVLLTLATSAFLTTSSALNMRAAKSEDIQTFFGTRNVKLVFWAQDSGLAYVDYSEAPTGEPTIHLIPGTVNARFPVISPDGKWVAYATGVTMEYDLKVSTAWMQELSETGTPNKVADSAYVPRFVQNATNPTVIYGTQSTSPNGDRYVWQGLGKVVKREWTGSGWAASVVWSGGSYLGGLSWDNRYLAHAQQLQYPVLLDLQDTAGGPAILHCLGVETQVCNSSISSSRIFTNTIMYFDFGGTAASLGRPWSTHQRIFITRYDGCILRYYPVPDSSLIFQTPTDSIVGIGEINGKKWNYPEWSNHPYYAAATGEISRVWKRGATSFNSREMNEKVFAIDLRKDSTYLCMVKATDTSENSTVSMQNPWLWVEVPQGFTEDPQWLSTALFTPTAVCTVPAIVAPIDSTRLTSIPDQQVVFADENAGRCQTLTFTVAATGSGTITFSVTGKPAGAMFDSASGVFSWTPTTADIGTHTLTFTASNGVTSDTETMTITVPEPSQPERKGCGCGAGTGLALLPPIAFKLVGLRRRRRGVGN